MITVYLSGLYTLGITDYLDIRKRHPEVNCIVLASNWLSYTAEAKEEAKRDKVGLFDMSDFMGALHAAKFWNYQRPQPDSDQNRGGSQSA